MPTISPTFPTLLVCFLSDDQREKYTSLLRALNVCQAINATITPSPFTLAQEGENVTLTCQVSQRRRSSSLPVVKWTFRPEHSSSDEELLIAKVNMRKARFYGNYTKSFPWPKLKLTVVKQGKIFDLLIMNISAADRGLYICRVQEFKRHQSRWKASTNCTAATELRDMYLCAALLCSVGLVCMCMFTVVVTCQYVQRKRLKGCFSPSCANASSHCLIDSYHLVKSPQNSSGETVTSLVSVSPALPKKQRRYRRKRSKEQSEIPPEIPAKAPIADKIRKPKLLKAQPRKVVLPKIAEESLTYAELELVKPLPDNKASCTGTVYAEILFKERYSPHVADHQV
ncbi:V-set and transmembrane domain-containing protein 4-like isoform 6-T6 [Salvelinus alpinus]